MYFGTVIAIYWSGYNEKLPGQTRGAGIINMEDKNE